MVKMDFSYEEPDDAEEQKLARIKALLDDAREAKSLEQQQAELEREAKLLLESRKARTGKDRHASVVTMLYDAEDGEVKALSVAINHPSDAMNALMDQRPFIFTGLVWSQLSIPDREEALAEAGLDPELAAKEDGFDVLPEATRAYCLAWQRMINSGEAWETSQTIGETGDYMIGAGFCLYGPAATSAPFVAQPGREDIPPGKPGTAAFVRAMMGARYLDWLLFHEPLAAPEPLN